MRGPYNEALGPETAGRLVMHRNYAPFKCPNFRLFIGKGPQTKIDLAYSGKLKQFPKKMKLYNDSSSKASCFFSGPFAVHSPPKRKGQNFIQRIAAPKKSCFQLQSFQSGSAQLLVAVDMDCASMLLSESLPRVDTTLHVSSC